MLICVVVRTEMIMNLMFLLEILENYLLILQSFLCLDLYVSAHVADETLVFY